MLAVDPGSTMLNPLNGSAHKPAQIAENDIIGITFTLRKHSALEIQTNEKKLICILQANTDRDELCRQFEEKVGKKIVFEGR